MSSRSLQRSWLVCAAVAWNAGALAEEPARLWHAVPVEGGIDSLARTAGLEPGLPAWRVLYEASRRKHGLWGEDAGGLTETSETGAAVRAGAVPLPLPPAFWRGVVRNGKSLPDGQLPHAILADRRAALFYRGIAGFDEETLAALAADGETLRGMERRNADVLAAFASRFAVRGGAAVLPGGAEAEAIWQAVVGESPKTPARFLKKLLERDAGRLAFVYDSVARLSPARQRLALGLPSREGTDAAAPLRELIAAFASEVTWWRSGRGAFARPDADAARLLREVKLAEDGSIAPPASRAFWAAVLEGQPATPEAIRASPRVDVAWLAARVGSGEARRRRLRLEQISFAQRVFGARADEAPAEAMEALTGLVDARALVLMLERLGSRDPAFFAAVLKGTRAALVFGSWEELSRAHAGFQGALAVVDRAHFNGSLDTAAAERLVRSLVEVPLPTVVPWERGLGGWVQKTLLPELAASVGFSGDADQIVLRAMAGASTLRPSGSAFDWEGLWYRAQPERAELRRLEGVRKRQGGRRLAEALASCREPAETERRAKRDSLARSERGGAGGAAQHPLQEERRTCAHAVAEALLSIVYAGHLGEPDGPALRGEDPARRHSFESDPWALPLERAGPGIPWHVQGSLLGLETALARLALRPIDPDALPDRVPVIDAVQRRGLALGAGLANGSELRDSDAEALAAAVEAGQRRVQSLQAGDPELEAVARDAGLDPWRARALEWLLAHDPKQLASFFALNELAYLGRPAGGAWDGWGAADPLVAGLKLRLQAPRPLDDSSGRQPERALAEVFVDLGVRVAMHLTKRGLPARLAPAFVATLMPALFVEARPIAPDDRLALDAWVRDQPADRLDDAVASLVGRGPLQPAPAPGRTQ